PQHVAPRPRVIGDLFSGRHIQHRHSRPAAPAGSLIDLLRGTIERCDDAINRRKRARAMRAPHPRRFAPPVFSARTAPVLWTFERGSAALVCGNAGLQSSAIVAAKPKKLERLMPSSVARRSIRAIRL